ncbi:MAG TPA: 5-oxoprolinase subunit PxpA, partial [Pyrinomonadaceae bacterium]|nr:5-oxoprolinase subunit PxpA [Pyrinomonadaceae bacterium]
MRSIDLNCDLGEGCDNDAELMKYISSANIACGFHAGDTATMRRTAELAIAHGVAIGAHPGYRDRENFGRTLMSLPVNEVFELVREQILAMKDICDSLGVGLHHVKPHGAMYNQAARDKDLAAAIAEAVASVNKEMILYGLSQSYLISQAKSAGLRTASEVFADRTYRTDGSLTPRSEPNALITDDEVSVQQAMRMVEQGNVVATSGDVVSIVAETICLHGDGEHAVDFARAIRNAL